MTVIGIDLGTTNSLVVTYRDGKVEMIPNQFNEYLTPSVVSIDGNQLIVGKIAKERLITHPRHTASLFKRQMGTSKTYSLGHRTFFPEELSALVVKQLVEDAKQYLKEEIDEIVVSVPAYFNAKQRGATKKIGEILGIKVERLINEPSAAAIACREGDDFETFIVFDFGGGTLDVSVVDCFENVISICSIAGDNQLGGNDFDEAILHYFCKQNTIKLSDLDTSRQRSLLLNAERVKIDLQTKESVEMTAIIDNIEYRTTFNLEIVETISMTILHKIKKVIANAVKESGFEVDEFSQFILVGGSSYMPMLTKYLSELIKIPVIQNQNIDLLVAQGLGKYIAIKQRDEHVKEIVVTDICPFSLTTAIHNEFDTENSLSHTIIAKNTVLPTSKSTLLNTVNPAQRWLDFFIYQGEAMYVKDNLHLGSTTIKLPKNKTKKNQSMKVTYSYDINSMLYVEIELLTNNEVHTFHVSNNGNLEKVTNKKGLDTIKSISVKLNKEPEVEFVIQRALRLFEEADEDTKEHINQQLKSLKRVLLITNNNLKKRMQLTNSFNSYLDQIEKHQDINQLDIFKQEEDEDDEQLLS